MDEATTNALIDEAVLTDGLRRLVKFKGNKPADEVVIRIIPPSLWPKFGTVSEAERVALLADRALGWVDTLAPASYELILELGEAINRDFFKRFLARQEAHQEKLMPGFADKLIREVVTQLAKPVSPSPTGSPKSRPIAG